MLLKNSQRKKLIEVIKFLVVFNILAAPMYFVLYYNLTFEPLQNFIAFISTKLLQALGIDAVQQNSLITLFANNQLLKIDISFDSTGWKTLYALFALTVATPKRKMKGKIKFLAIGLPVLFVLNFARIITTILVAVYFGFQYFEVVHLFLWREGLIAAVLVIWYLWLTQEVK
jgi:exosortase/archaeosortase family protein